MLLGISYKYSQKFLYLFNHSYTVMMFYHQMITGQYGYSDIDRHLRPTPDPPKPSTTLKYQYSWRYLDKMDKTSIQIAKKVLIFFHIKN